MPVAWAFRKVWAVAAYLFGCRRESPDGATGDCKINARVGRLAECGGRLMFRPSRACPATRPDPRTPDLNVGSKRGPERCKINARFCAGRTRPSLRSTLKSGGRGERPSAEIQRPAPPRPLPMQRKRKRAFILQSPVAPSGLSRRHPNRYAATAQTFRKAQATGITTQ